MFYTGTVCNKDDAISIVCHQAESVVHGLDKNSNLTSNIQYRETISTTYFGNEIAIPHPLSPLTSRTYVSVAISKKPIKWDALHDVRIIMLVLIEKNNPRALQLWHYISSFVHDDEAINKLIENPTYSNFISLLTYSLHDQF